MSINSKITLKVKTGPGEIVGETELNLVDNSVDFNKIQFTEPGEYIISVIPSNTEDIEPSQFSINVEPEEEVIPQEDSESDSEREPLDGTRPIIAQILQPSIKLNPIEFEASNDDLDNKEIHSSLGFTPFVWYNGSQIRISDVKKMFLYYDEMIPKCLLTVNDTIGLLNSPETSPLNDTNFEIFLNSGSDILKSIHLKFKIEFNKKNKNGTNTLTGVIDIDNFYNRKYSSYDETSFNVFKKVSKELGIGYNSNIVNTDDKMKWRKRGTNYQTFLKEVLSHSYVSDDSFLMAYIDFYWCLNYVNLEKEWKRDISNDLGLNTQGVSSIGKDEIVNMELTNDLSSNSSSFFFTNYKLSNNSTYQTVNKGIFTSYKSYDRKNKQILKFNIDSLTSESDDVIILKGSTLDSKSLNDNFTNEYGGKIDTDNVHPNFLYAKELNKRNLNNLINISIDFTLPQPNFNLYLYQKIKMIFVNPKQTVTNDKIFDERLTGDWMIVDISFTWSMGSLTQKIKAVRKELGKTKTEKENQQVSPNRSAINSEINENPIDF